MYIST